MGRIRSAWEIAMEKTADIEFDEEKYRMQNLDKEGMSLAGKYLSDPQMKREELEKKYKSYSNTDCEIVRKGIASCILSNIALPSDDAFKMRFERLTDIAVTICGDNASEADAVMGQIMSLMDQYLNARDELVQNIQQQINQMVQNNPQTDRSQFAKVIEQNLANLEAQYKGALEQAKESIAQIIEN